MNTDKIDAAILARLYAGGFLPEIWVAEDTLRRRRQTAERMGVLELTVRTKGRIHSILHANLRMAGRAAAMACSFHANRQFLLQSGRTLLRRHHRKQIRRGVHRSTAELEIAIQAHLDAVNADPKPFRWTKSADDIPAAVERFCLKTLDIAAAQAKIATTSESGQ